MKLLIGNYRDILNECIIATGKCKSKNIFIVKHRDRAYYPRIEIIRDEVMADDVLIERVYIYDIETGWAEGVCYNSKTKEYIAIFNTALAVEHDEKEKKTVSKSQIKSIDGETILSLLALGDYDSICENLKSEDTLYVRGHTFVVSSNGKANKFEQSAEEECFEDTIDLEKISVRTNHGYFGNSGYIIGNSYASSKLRKTGMEKLLKDKNNQTIIEILNNMKQKEYEYDSEYNLNRDCELLKTTGQLGVDLTKGIFYYDNLNNKSEIIHILDRRKSEEKPNIKIDLLNYPLDNLEWVDL